MGCFSYLCKVSGKPALSSSFSGTDVYLFLLKDGKVIEEMRGNYNSYGGVFKNELRKDVKHELHDSFKWKMDWGDVCNLSFNSNASDGIAMVISECYKGVVPTTISDGDPDQGWGESFELLGSTSDKLENWVKEPYHKVYEEIDMSNYVDEDDIILGKFSDENIESTVELIKRTQELLDKLNNE